PLSLLPVGAAMAAMDCRWRVDCRAKSIAAMAAPTGKGLAAPVDQRAIPVAVRHVHRQELNAFACRPAPPRVLHDLAGRVEPHRLRVEQRAGERRRFVALEPAACVDQLGERGGVALREAVGTEALDLLEDPFNELGC